MVGLNFEGFTDGLQPLQYEFVESVLKTLGYDEGVVKVEPVGKAGDNYTADVRRFIVEKDGKTVKLVGKIAASAEQMRLAFNMHNVFFNEHIVYNTILPKYKKLEETAGVPENERFKFAKCYGSLMKEPSEIILLQDLQVEGFRMLDKFKSLPDEAVRLVLKDFAAINSLSYAWKRKEPESFRWHTSKLFDMWKSREMMQQMKLFFSKLEEDTIAILDDEKYGKYLRNLLKQFTDILDVLDKKEDEKYFIIQQGDSWTNNIMFRVEDDKPIQSCMIDYQMSRVSSPAIDFSYFIFNCTDHAMRMKHFHDWIDYYYSQLDKYLSYHGLKSEVIYPRGQLDKELKKFGVLSLVQGILVSSVILREVGDAEKFKETLQENKGDNFEQMLESSKVSAMKSETVAMFKTRTEELIDSHLELGLISPK